MGKVTVSVPNYPAREVAEFIQSHGYLVGDYTGRSIDASEVTAASWDLTILKMELLPIKDWTFHFLSRIFGGDESAARHVILGGLFFDLWLDEGTSHMQLIFRDLADVTEAEKLAQKIAERFGTNIDVQFSGGSGE